MLKKVLCLALGLLSLLLLPVTRAEAAWGLVNTVRAFGLNPPQASGTANFTGANLIVVQVTWSGGGGGGYTEPVLSDNNGNTFTPLTSYSLGGDIRSRLYYAINPTVTSSYSITLSTGTGSGSIAVSAEAAGFSDSLTSGSPFDQEVGASEGAYTTALPPGSITAASGNLFVAALSNFATGAISIDSSFTIAGTPVTSDGANYYSAALAYKVSTGAAENPFWSWSAVVANQATAAMASFKPTSGAPPPQKARVIVNIMN